MKLTEDDYEKARQWDEHIRLQNNPELIKITVDYQTMKQSQKLRELIEELTDGDFQTITRAFGTSGIYTSIQLVRILDIFNRLEKLLEESKKN